MRVDFDKYPDKLVPVIVQDETTLQVLMLGYMDAAAFEKTLSEKRLTFFSRSKQRLWTKGETSGNYLKLASIAEDCDQDALLAKVKPAGPVCHQGTKSCFGEAEVKGFLYQLEEIINWRITEDAPESYTNKLYRSGINKIAQKVGEEAVELVIEAKDDNDDLFNNEAADLLYHYLILLKAKNKSLIDIEKLLQHRHNAANKNE